MDGTFTDSFFDEPCACYQHKRQHYTENVKQQRGPVSVDSETNLGAWSQFLEKRDLILSWGFLATRDRCYRIQPAQSRS